MLLIEDPRIAKYKSNLKKVRIIKGFTQEELSQLSGVNIKSITLYEQCPEKLLNASVNTVYNLSQSLGCDIQDILNKDYLKEK